MHLNIEIIEIVKNIEYKNIIFYFILSIHAIGSNKSI